MFLLTVLIVMPHSEVPNTLLNPLNNSEHSWSPKHSKEVQRYGDPSCPCPLGSHIARETAELNTDMYSKQKAFCAPH